MGKIAGKNVFALIFYTAACTLFDSLQIFTEYLLLWAISECKILPKIQIHLDKRTQMVPKRPKIFLGFYGF